MESTVGRQVRHVLAIDVGKREVEEAMAGLQALGFTATSRGGLKSAVKLKTLQVYRSFLSSYRPFVRDLSLLSDLLKSLHSRLDSLYSDLSSIEERTSDTVRLSKSLKSERDSLRLKQSVLTSLLNSLTLTHEEIERLTSADQPVTKEYFETLRKLVEIKRTAERLQAEEHKLLAASLEEYLTQVQEAAYEKIFRFMQQQAKMLEHETFSGYDQFATAVTYLKERPLYYDHFRSEIIRCRQLYIVRKFHESSSSLPLDCDSIGRLLAWIHSALISEQQLVSAILQTVDTVPQPGENLQETTVIDLIADAMTRHFAIKVDQMMAGAALQQLAKAFSVIDFSINSLTDANLLTFTSKLVGEMFKVKGFLEEKMTEAARKRIAHVKALGLQLQDLRTPPAYLELVDEFVSAGKELSQSDSTEVFHSLIEIIILGGVSYYEDLSIKSGGATAALIMLLNVCDYCKFKLSETEMAVGCVEMIERKLADVEAAILTKAKARVALNGEDMTMAQLARIREKLEEGDISEFLAVDKVRNKNAARRLQNEVVNALVDCYQEGYKGRHIKPECTPEELRETARRRFQ